MKNMLLIINPYSGKIKIKGYLLEICQLFCQAGYEVTVHVTEKIREYVCSIMKNDCPYELIVCSGGDGSFNSFISGMMPFDSHPELGYIPSASTNDFARSLNIPTNPADAARSIIKGSFRQLDIGKFNNVYFTYVASFGAFTECSYNTPQELKNHLGHMAYILSGITDISKIRSYHMKVETEDLSFEDDYIWGAVCNSTSIAGIIKLDNKIVDYNDGLFEVILIKSPKTLIDMTKIIVSLNSQDYNSDMITFFQGKDVCITSEDPIAWSLDGEYNPGGREVHITNIPGAIQIKC